MSKSQSTALPDNEKSREQLIKELSDLRTRLAAAEERLSQQASSPHQVGQERQNGEDRFALALQAAQEGVWDWNLETGEVYYSPQWKKILGYDEDEIEPDIGAWERLLHPDDREGAIALKDAVLRGEAEYRMEFRLRHKDGSYRTILSYGVPLRRGADGPIIRLVGNHLDITERKRAEGALRESERLWATTLASIGDAVITTDPAGRITFLNPIAEALTGWSLAEAGGLPVEKVFHILNEETRSEVGNPVTRVLETGQVVGPANHTMLVRKDGTEVPIDDSGAPIRDEDGVVFGVVLAFRDIRERKKAEQVLQNSERRFRALFEHMQEALFVYTPVADEKGHIFDVCCVEVNPAAERFVRKTRAELIGRTSNEVLGGSPTQSSMDAFRHVALTEEPIHYVEFSNRLGRWYEAYMYAPQPGQVAMIVQDITEHKRAEQVLRASEARFRSVLDNSRDAVYRMNAQTGHYEYISPSAEAVVGYTVEELMGLSAEASLAMVHPDDRKAFRAAIECLEASGETELEYRQRTKGGGYRWLSNRMSLIRDEAGRPLYRSGNIRDISERKEAEEALRESEYHLARAQQIAHLGSWSWDIAEDRLYWSDETFRLFGLQPGEVVPFHRDFMGYIHHADRERVEKSIQAAFVHGRYTAEFRIIQKGGRERYLASEGYVSFDEQGNPAKAEGSIQDISERKSAEDALQRLNETLEQQVAERTAVAEQRARQLQVLALQLTEAEERERRRIADLLHDDLQQLLAAARFHLSVVLPTVEGQPASEPMLRQADQLLERSIEKSRRLSQDLSPTILFHSGLPAAVQWLAKQMQERHGMRVKVESSSPRVLQNDLLRVFLYRSIKELLFNVVKHSGVDRALVRMERLEDRIDVTVSDQGKGFDPQDLGRIDLPSSGTGVISIQERTIGFGGNLEITSAPGAGSRFRFSIPLEVDLSKRLLPLHSAPEVLSRTLRDKVKTDVRYRILLVDDHQVLRQGLIAVLDGQPDIQVIGEAPNGREAVELARSLKPDVILMDVLMPEMDGIEATRIVKRELPQIRVIGLSMLGDEDVSEQLMKAGAEGYINKGRAAETLVEAIREKESGKADS